MLTSIRHKMPAWLALAFSVLPAMAASVRNPPSILFVIADQFNADGSVFVKALVNPLVNLIWLAGLLFVAGSLITLWPDAREQRRLALRFAEEGALARA